MPGPTLACGDCRLELAPECGGAVAAFEWRGLPVFRRMAGSSVLDAACFPMVPFANRIPKGRFSAGGREIRLPANLPGADRDHPLHGYGWLNAWQITELSPESATMEHHHEPGDWPWPYRARQGFALAGDGLTVTLSVCNLGDSPMPAGLGLHPYFPRSPEARYLGLHRGEWTSDAAGLPVSLDLRDAPRDWWQGQPVGAREIDTVQTGRDGPLHIDFPENGIRLSIEPSSNLPCTAVFVPQGADFFCIEPMSHATDAINRAEPGASMAWLDPQASLTAQVTFRLSPLPHHVASP